jgi:adenine-specific DNA methylase
MAKQRAGINLDFDTGDQSWDALSDYRLAQDRLSEIKNPYIGNKRAIVVDIALLLNKHNVHHDTVFDLFSGSGVVSVFFKLIGKRVISNDILASSYFNALALCENNKVVLTDDELAELCKNDNPNKSAFVRQRFGGVRFTDEEALFLDNYYANMVDLITRKKAAAHDSDIDYQSLRILEAVAVIALQHYVLNRCFLGGRLNKGQVLADLQHRLEHQRNTGDAMLFQIPHPPTFFVPGRDDCLATNLDCLDALRAIKERTDIPVDLCYIDPPYGGQQSDYAEMFRFNEEYATRKPLEEHPLLTKAKRFSTAKEYDAHFRELLAATKGIPALAISYNDSSWADIETVKGIVAEHRQKVIVENISHQYRYRKARGSAVEYLIIAK